MDIGSWAVLACLAEGRCEQLDSILRTCLQHGLSKGKKGVVFLDVAACRGVAPVCEAAVKLQDVTAVTFHDVLWVETPKQWRSAIVL